MTPKLIIAFKDLGEPAFLAKAQNIVAKLTGNAAFPAPWPAQVPTLAGLTTAVGAYQTAFLAAKNGDRVKIAERNAKRATVTGMLKELAPYLEIVAGGDVAVLETTGYELQHDRTHSTGPGPLPAPEFLRVERNGGTGQLLARVQPVAGAASYEVQLATADPAVEANWKQALIAATPGHMTLSGLTPGTMYYVRVRAIGSHGPGIWATSSGVIAV